MTNVFRPGTTEFFLFFFLFLFFFWYFQHCGLTHSQHFGITNRGVGVMKFTIYPPKQDGLKMSEINFIPREVLMRVIMSADTHT